MITALIDAWAIFRHGLFRLVPAARELVLERVRDAIVVVDPDGRVLDLNCAAERMLRARVPALPNRIVGMPGVDLLVGDLQDQQLVEGEQRSTVNGREVVFDLQIKDLVDRRGRPELLLEAADRALYAAKDARRNRVLCATS